MDFSPTQVYDYDADALINALQKKREAAGITYEQLDAASGVPASTIRKIFSRSTKDPSFQAVARLARALDISLDTLSDAALPTPEDAGEMIQDGAINAALLSHLVRSYRDRIFAMECRERKAYYKNIAKDALLAVAICGFVFYFVWDITHPLEGMIRYQVDLSTALTYVRNFISM